MGIPGNQGEDLPLLAFKGTRRAFFPEQPWAPLTHAICGLLVFGVFPLILELCVERFFAFPDLVELTLGGLRAEEIDSRVTLWPFVGLRLRACAPQLHTGQGRLRICIYGI